MFGPSISDSILKGIAPRMVDTVFESIMNTPDHIEFRVKLSIIEIYKERIRDLLDNSKNNLSVREDRRRGIYI